MTALITKVDMYHEYTAALCFLLIAPCSNATYDNTHKKAETENKRWLKAQEYKKTIFGDNAYAIKQYLTMRLKDDLTGKDVRFQSSQREKNFTTWLYAYNPASLVDWEILEKIKQYAANKKFILDYNKDYSDSGFLSTINSTLDECSNAYTKTSNYTHNDLYWYIIHNDGTRIPKALTHQNMVEFNKEYSISVLHKAAIHDAYHAIIPVLARSEIRQQTVKKYFTKTFSCNKDPIKDLISVQHDDQTIQDRAHSNKSRNFLKYVNDYIIALRILGCSPKQKSCNSVVPFELAKSIGDFAGDLSLQIEKKE